MSFRALIRAAVAIQLVGTFAIVGFLVVSSYVTSSSASQLVRASTAALDAADMHQLFTVSDNSLQRYIENDNFETLTGYASAQVGMPAVADRMARNSPKPLSREVTDWFGSYLRFQRSFQKPVLSYMTPGPNGEPPRRARAEAVLLSPEGRAQFNALADRVAAIDNAAEQHRDDTETRVNRLQYLSIALAAAVALALAIFDAVLFVLVRREFAIPMAGLATSARKIGHGDFSQRALPSSVQEIAVVAQSFNTMADEVGRKVDELRQTTVDRSQFVSSVSHELRTPTTSLRGYLEMLASGDAGELTPEQQRYIEIAERNARQLDELIGDLLTLSRLEHGGVQLNLAAIDVSELILNLKAEMLPIANEKKIDIIVVQTGDLTVEIDEVRVRQALANLVSNAIKFSGDGQAVVIRAFRDGDNLTIAVADWGVGIPAVDLPKVAEPFYRATSHDRIPGTGLGLAIAKQMAELHGGLLRVESEVGRGSTFTLILPVHQASPVVEDVAG